MSKRHLTITIKADREMASDAREASNLISMIALDIHQGLTGGFIRNQKTGEENGRWELNVVDK
jgi:hypothetical protein